MPFRVRKAFNSKAPDPVGVLYSLRVAVVLKAIITGATASCIFVVRPPSRVTPMLDRVALKSTMFSVHYAKQERQVQGCFHNLLLQS